MCLAKQINKNRFGRFKILFYLCTLNQSNMELRQALINSGNADDVTEANEIIKEMRERMLDGENPEELLYEYGLEPDYIMDLLW
jgi:hypothetical protein